MGKILSFRFMVATLVAALFGNVSMDLLARIIVESAEIGGVSPNCGFFQPDGELVWTVISVAENYLGSLGSDLPLEEA